MISTQKPESMLLKKIPPFIIFALFLMLTLPESSKAQVMIGGGVSASTGSELVGFQGHVGIALPFTGLRILGEGVFYIPEEKDGADTSSWEANLNGHYVAFDELSLSSYVLAGLNITNIEVEGAEDSKAGFNLGLGAQFSLGVISAFTEVKYVFSEFDAFNATFGVRF